MPQSNRSTVDINLFVRHFNSANVDKVTPAQVKAAARKHLHSAEAIVVVVGDGSAGVIQRNAEGQDVPLTDGSGKQLTLREALDKLAAEGTFGKGGLMVLDADGKPRE
jgi:hypothetical protein